MRLLMAGALALACMCGNAIASYGFDPVVALAPEALGASSIAIGDVTGDGRADVVALGTGSHAFYRGKVVVYAQQAAGGFAAPITHAFTEDLLEYPKALGLADMDDDGALDVVVSYELNFQNRVAVLRNGGGQFSVATHVSASRIDEFRFMDVDQDGQLDIVARAAFYDGRILFGNGRGGIRSESALPVNYTSLAWQLADMNNDGRRDLVYSTYEGIVMHRNQGAGFESSPTTLLRGSSRSSMVVGDFNGDGRNDVASTRYSFPSGLLEVYLQDRNGAFRRAQRLSTSDGSSTRMIAHDMDGDGRDDLLRTRYGGLVEVHFSGLRGLAPAASFLGDEATGGFVLGDINADGRSDMAMARGGVSLMLSRAAPIENDLAVYVGLAPTAAAVRVENVGALASRPFSLRAKFDTRSGTLALGALPAGCFAYGFNGYTDVTCSTQPALPAGQYRLYNFTFSRSNPGLANTLTGFARISVSPDLREDNNVAYRQIDIPAAAPAQPPAPAPVPLPLPRKR